MSNRLRLLWLGRCRQALPNCMIDPTRGVRPRLIRDQLPQIQSHPAGQCAPLVFFIQAQLLTQLLSAARFTLADRLSKFRQVPAAALLEDCEQLRIIQQVGANKSRQIIKPLVLNLPAAQTKILLQQPSLGRTLHR